MAPSIHQNPPSISLQDILERSANPVEYMRNAPVIWGEPDGGSQKTTVEDHQQIEVGVTVAPVPYSRAVRDSYEGAWRKKGQV